MVDVTSRLRLVVDSTGLDRGGRKLKDLKREAREARMQAERLRSAFAGLAGVLGAAFSVREVTRAVDAYRGIENQLKLVTASAQELRSAQEGVLSVANATGAALDTTAGLYASLERFAGDFLNTQEDTLALTQAINQAAAVSGAGVQETSNAIRQLTQGIAGGILRAEEFNSIIENMPRLGQAIADGLGVGIGELRRQVNDGLITSERLITSLQSQFGTLADEFGQASLTIGQAMQVVGNSITVELGQKLSGVQDIAVDALLFIGQNLQDLIGALQVATVAAGTFGAALAAAFAIKAGTTIATTVVQLVALEKALGAATTATALQGVALKGLQASLLRVGAIIAANPIGAIATGITVAVTAIYSFRDAIAGMLFGVRDAGAVIQAVSEVLGDRFRKSLEVVTSALAAFAGAAGQAFSTFVARAAEAVSVVRDAVMAIVPEGALETVSRFAQAVVDLFRSLGGVVFEILTDAVLAPIRLAAAALAKLGQIQLLPEGARDRIQGAADALKQLAEQSDALTGKETIQAFGEVAENIVSGVKTVADGSVEVFEEIRERAAEIAAENAESTKTLQTQQKSYDGIKKSAEAVAKVEGDRAKALEKAKNALESEKQAIKDKQFLLKAAREGERQEEIARELLRLRRAGLDIELESVRALAKQNVQLDEQLDRTRELRDETKGLFEGLGGTISDLWRKFTTEGFGALGDLGSAIGDLFKEGIGGFGKGLQDFLSNPQGIFGGQGGVQQFGQLLAGAGTVGTYIAAAQQGGRLGTDLANAIDGNGVSRDTGRFTENLGFIPALLGGLFSKASDEFARGVFSGPAGVNTFESNKPGSRNVGARDDFEKALSTVTSTITDVVGGTFAEQLAFQIENSRGFIGLRDANFRGGGDAAFVDANIAFTTKNETEALRLSVLQLLGSLQGANQELADLLKNSLDAGLGVEQAIELVATVQELTGAESNLGPFARDLKELNKRFDDAISSAKGVADAERVLIEARDAATQQLVSRFQNEVTEAQRQRSGSVLAGFGSVASGNASLLSDDIALQGSGDFTRSLRIGQFEDFFTAALQSGRSVQDLTSSLDDFRQIVLDAGGEIAALEQGFQNAIGAQRDFLNNQVQDELAQYLNGPADQLERLLEQINSRRAQIEAVGGDIAEFERLAALQLRDFFTGLTDDAVQEVESYLGLFEDATASIARNLDLSRQELQSRADSFGRYAQGFADLNFDLSQRFLAQSPREGLDGLRGRASELLGQIQQGNESAAQALPQVLNNLIGDARSAFGNTQQFAEVLAFAQSIAAQAEQASLNVQSEAERQIAALDENNDLLGEIRDILQASASTNSVLRAVTSGDVQSVDALLSLIQSGAGLTPANDNASTLSVASVLTSQLQPLMTPLVGSLDRFTQQLAPMPQLQTLTIEAIDRSAQTISGSVSDLNNTEERSELLLQKILKELENLNSGGGTTTVAA